MELLSKILEQKAFNTRPKTEEHMLIVMDKPVHEEHLFHRLQTDNKQFKRTITFLTGYNGIFNVKNLKNYFYFAKSITDEDGFIQNTIPPYKIESLNNEIMVNIIAEGYFNEIYYPFTINLNFSTLGSIIETSRPKPSISFLPDDCKIKYLGIIAATLYEE